MGARSLWCYELSLHKLDSQPKFYILRWTAHICPKGEALLLSRVIGNAGFLVVDNKRVHITFLGILHNNTTGSRHFLMRWLRRQRCYACPHSEMNYTLGIQPTVWNEEGITLEGDDK